MAPPAAADVNLNVRPVRLGAMLQLAWMWFLTLAPLNYFYVTVFGWQVSWIASGGVSEGAPAVIKYAKDIAALLIYALYAAALVFRAKRRFNPIPLISALVGLFFAWECLTTLLAVTVLPPAAAMIALWQNAGYILFYFVTRSVLLNAPKELWTSLAKRFAVITALVSVYGIYQRYFDQARFQYWLPSGEVSARAVSTLGQPNNLAYFLLIATALLVAFHQPRKKWARTLLFASVGWCFILTLSMSATAALMVVLPLLLGVQLRRKALVTLVPIVLIAALLAPLVVTSLAKNSPVLARFKSVASGRDVGLQERLSHWPSLLNRKPWEWVIGSGPGTGGAISISFFSSDVADNNYLAVLLQFGAVGMVLFLAICAVALIESGQAIRALRYRSDRRGSTQMAAHLLRFCAVVSFLVVSISANVLNMFPINLLFWVIIAMPSAYFVENPAFWRAATAKTIRAQDGRGISWLTRSRVQ